MKQPGSGSATKFGQNSGGFTARLFTVAHVSNRFPTGRIAGFQPAGGWKLAGAGGLEIRDTADWKSALLKGRAPGRICAQKPGLRLFGGGRVSAAGGFAVTGQEQGVVRDGLFDELLEQE
jgi:hypothetical protein